MKEVFMDWIPVVLGTVSSMTIATVISALMGRTSRREKARSPSYKDLKQQRDVLLFWFTFVGFWILLAAPRVDWSYFGQPWTGLFFMLCLMAVLTVAGSISRRIGRSKPDASGPLPPPP
jgi:hypothetical protein